LPKCRNAPAEVKRQLRQEAFFGCAFCGNPLLENAHIIEYSLTKEFPVEDMVALCPICHTEADLAKYPKQVYRDAKLNPYNKKKSTVGKRFVIYGENMVVNLGSCKFTNVETVLQINNFNLISIRRLNGLYLSLDVTLFDRLQRLLAKINDNYWQVDRRYFWDIEYKPQHLTLRNAPRDITFEIQINNNEVFIRGKIFFNGFLVNITSNILTIGRGLQFVNMKMGNARVGISCNV
jgi:hypothetical protein